MEDITTNTTKKRKRRYAAHRTTKSVRKSKTPGVQVLSLRDDMTEIKQADYRPHASLRCRQDEHEMSFDTAIEDNSLASSPQYAQIYDGSYKASWPSWLALQCQTGLQLFRLYRCLWPELANFPRVGYACGIPRSTVTMVGIQATSFISRPPRINDMS